MFACCRPLCGLVLCPVCYYSTVVTLQQFLTHFHFPLGKKANRSSVQIEDVFFHQKKYIFLYFLAPILHMPPILTGDMLIIKNDTQRWQNVYETCAGNLHSFLLPLQRLGEFSPVSCLNTVNNFFEKIFRKHLQCPYAGSYWCQLG